MIYNSLRELLTLEQNIISPLFGAGFLLFLEKTDHPI